MNTSSQLAKKRFDSSGKKENHYKRILKALEELKNGCSKEIAEKCGLDYHQVSRRLPELEKKGKIEVLETAKTKYYETSVNIYQIVG